MRTNPLTPPPNSSAAQVENAEVQAARGTAVLMFEKRQLHILTKSLQVENRVDQRSRIFPPCISPHMAWMDIHWIAANDEGILHYYLHHVQLY